jgi:hypothetical protein
MAVNSFSTSYFAARYFRSIWFAEADDAHLLPEELSQYYGSGRASHPRRVRGDDSDLIRQVLDKWETIERVRALDAPIVEPLPVEIRPEPVAEDPESVLAESFSPQVIALIDAPAPFSPDKAAAALAARRRNDEEALIMMLLEL